ncbi:MAG TPA: UbiA family prenyltransferase [Roseiarcus sp.]|jgi:4-hydroxybenzoate polyprenyltransferase/phosphoserine phosphatase
MNAELRDREAPSGAEARTLPLIVDMDGTLLRTDTLYECFAAAIFRRPADAAMATARLFADGRAAYKQRLAALAEIDCATLPLNEPLVEYLRSEAARGREVHLATAADRSLAEAVAQRLDLFASVHASEDGHNLKGARKGERLQEAFPDGFVYAGDCAADIPVWRRAAGAIVVSGDAGLARRVGDIGVPLEQVFTPPTGGWRAWMKAARPHQWAKNALVMVPVVLGFHLLTRRDALAAVAAMALLCALASLTYMLNDIADLAADRRHWTKSRRPFASGALPVERGLVVAAIGIPVLLGLGFWVSVGTGVCLTAYLALTLAYSLGLKRVPMLDVTVIATLFTLRLALGMTAAGQIWSPWLLTFSMFFFFSLAIAKRHTELLRAAASGSGHTQDGMVHGRGFHVEDNDVTMTFGVGAAIASIVILVLYLTEEVFVHAQYAHPQWLWLAPMVVFLWTARVWLLSHRGQMTDDPVIFALRDRISLALGAVLAVAFAVAAV